ncbi:MULTISPECIES: PilZ domain-containing protein [unclassified Massilia]|uniref:PilZ domain-containing protein n=1 Tax=unclassified Massilia TaxID=2609279 RepID=UPI001E4714E6|nr:MULTISPECIES: PilZ domain-containing protein [unclassified Massilia]
MKTRAMVAAEGAAPVMGRTSDLNEGGVSISLPGPMAAGQTAQVRFDLLVEGQLVPINTRARVQYCILSGGDFKIGFQFVNLDMGATTALSRFLR